MTTLLDRLEIRGVRSFGTGDEDKGEIRFKRPLTLILGQNGCGKTTIIESLKYAAVGDKPPNSSAGTRGSGFVHDPKLMKSTEVMAQVKLRILDITGKKSTVIRSMSNTQKFKKVEFKTLDSVINTENEYGELEAISGRCVDIDRQMCYLLGVSKPILNYVIFCHQEESCWPMEEGKKLKERFDEIFDSVKYNKCMENIRKIKKERSSQVSLLKKDVETLNVTKNEAELKIKKLKDEEVRISTTTDLISACDNKLRELDGKLDCVRKKEIGIAELMAEEKMNNVKYEELRKAIKEIQTTLRNKEFQGSDDQLEKEIKSFNDDLSQKQSALNKLDSELKKLEDSERYLQAKLNEEQSSLGGLKRDVEMNKNYIQNRNELTNRLTADLKLTGMMSPYSETQMHCCLDSVEKKLQDIGKDVELIKMEHENEEKVSQQKIDEMREEKAKLEQIRLAKAEKLESTKAEMEKLKAEVDEISHATKNLSILDNRLKRINNDLEDEIKSVDVNEIDNQVKEMQRKRDSMEEELCEINKEVDDLIEADKMQTTLNSCLDRKVAIEEEIERLRSKHEDTLKHLLGEVADRNISQHLDLCLSRLTDKIRSSQRDISLKRQEVTRLESNYQHIEERLQRLNETLSSDTQQKEEICGGDDYEQLISTVTNSLRTSEDESGTLKASNYFYQEYIRKLQLPQPCCPLCRRHFEEDNSAITLADELKDRLKSIPSKLSSFNEDRERLSKKFTQLQQLKPVIDRISSLENVEIPSARKDMLKTKEELESMHSVLASMETELECGLQSDEQLARSIQADVITIDQKQMELDGLIGEIDEIQAKIPQKGKTLQHAKNQRDQMQFDLDNIRKKIDAIQTKKMAHSERMNKLQNDKNDIVKEQLRVQTGKQKEKQLLDRQNELKEVKAALGREIELASSQMLPVKQRLEQAVRDKDETRRKHASIVNAETNKVNAFKQRYDEVTKLQKRIEEFECRGIVAKLEEKSRNICQIKRDVDGFNEQKSSLQLQRDTVKADMANQDARQRDLLDNVKLREKRSEESRLEQTMKEMKQRLGVLDYSKIKVERTELQAKWDDENNKKHHAEGRQNELGISIANLTSEMKKPMYRDAIKNYKEKVIDLQVAMVANSDIDAYYVALDWALKHFHRERMKAINVIMKNLWRTIYRGHDIDYIEIKCDDSETSSADKKRVYNYRVVQVKDGVEMDMRGRCSAGQKMLASIIIRLALAETFSNNCAIMTLDEPTTNLDRCNIESLNQALVEIVNSQTKHKKFQLVIITHDEDFLMRLTRVSKVNHFWKVYKNENGLSRIEACPI